MVETIRQKNQARELIRTLQQGHGRPIISAAVGNLRLVAAGTRLFHSPTWKTFPDFLSDYIKFKLDPEWGNKEIKKPLSKRHPIMQWYDKFCRQQRRTIQQSGAVQSMTVTGAVACFMGTAYCLYLLDHNVELQDRLIARLKHPEQFQGAYYELLVAGILIRAGFELVLEDEADGNSKHCEFAAISKTTGKRYWVEAKMRAVDGRLGKTSLDGGLDNKPLARLIKHLNAALAKPASDERLIFIDLNVPSSFDQEGKPTWLPEVMARLERYEREELASNQTGYVFITNFCEHRDLDKSPKSVSVPFGLGLPDFNRPGRKNLGQIYREKKKHIDAHSIGEAIVKTTAFPETFDGTPPSQALLGDNGQIQIGSLYEFIQDNGKSITGIVDDIVVSTDAKTAFLAVRHNDKTYLVFHNMSDAEIEDYKLFGDAYFGKISHRSVNVLGNEYDLFESLMASHADMSCDKILEFFSKSENFAELEAMSEEDLKITYCEHLVASIANRSTKTSPPATGGAQIQPKAQRGPG